MPDQVVTPTAAAPAAQAPAPTAPPEAIAEMRQQMSQMVEDNRTLKEQLMLLANNARPGATQPASQPGPKDPIEAIGDDTVVMGSELKATLRALTAQNQQLLATLEARAAYPDIEQKLQTELPKLRQTDPKLAAMLAGPNGPAIAIYEMLKARGATAPANPTLDAALAAANRPLPAASAGGGGTASLQATINSMTDQQFREADAKKALPLK